MPRQDVPQAILFDLDGTLIDSEPYWIDAQRALMLEHGVPWTTELDTAFIGLGQDQMAHIMRQLGVDLPELDIIDIVAAKVHEHLARELPWRPGAKDFLHTVNAAQIPTALVTMSWSMTVAPVIELMGWNPFDTIVAGDNVEKAKPDPEPYLNAAARLGVDPTRAVAFEDSIPGTTAAVSAGTCTIVMRSLQQVPPNLPAEFWDNFDGRTVDDAVATFRAQAGATNA